MSIHAALADKVAYLFARWQDEKEFEDFEDYRAHMRDCLPEGATLTRMTPRPFRVEYTMPDGARRWISSTTRKTEWGFYESK